MDKQQKIMDKHQDTGKYILFCLAGGLIGWLLQLIVNIQPATVMAWMGYGSMNEVAGLPEAQVLSIIYPSARIAMMFFSGLLSCGLAYAMTAAELKTEQSWKDAVLKSLIALPIGLVIGAATGFLSEMIFEGGYAASSAVGLVLLTGVGWGIIGIGIALAVSLALRNWKAMIRNLIAGLCGGFITGILFGIMSASPAETDQLIKLAAALVLGLLMGIGVLVLKNIANESTASQR